VHNVICRLGIASRHEKWGGSSFIDAGDNPFRDPFSIQDSLVRMLFRRGLTIPLRPTQPDPRLEFNVCLQHLQELNKNGQKKP
jgi:hypothetical protein